MTADLFDVSFLGAWLAGLLSFASPCVLPLVPAYLCFIGGVSLDELSERRAATAKVFAAAVAFVLGFATVFVAMGASSSVLGAAIADNLSWLSVAAGVVIVGLGLHYMGLFRLAFLDVEKRLHPQTKPAGLAGAYVIGLAFAFGWTPCVGPVLATILLLAAGGDSVGYGVGLLSAYAAGIGLPFLAAALAVNPFLGFMKRFKRHMRAVELALGALLVATGLLIATGNLAAIANWLLQTFPVLGTTG